jgi:hypothetical protein
MMQKVILMFSRCSVVGAIFAAHIFTSCLSTEKATCEFMRMLNSGTPGQTSSNLRLDGAYQRIKPSYKIAVDFYRGEPTRYVTKPFLHAPWFFFDNGTVMFRESIELDSVGYGEGMSKIYKLISSSNWGVYSISGDTVHAIIYITYDNDSAIKQRVQLLTHFSGVAHSDGTIWDWHMVEPFPDKAERSGLNERVLDYFAKPTTLHFKSLPISDWIHPEMAWIQELKAQECK